MIVGRYLAFKRWKIHLDLTKEDDVTKIPLWIQLHNVPDEYWSSRGLTYLASVVRRPLFADSATLMDKRISYARICVELDASKPVVHEFDVQVKGSASNTSRVKVAYQWLSPICSQCQVFGHSTKDYLPLPT